MKRRTLLQATALAAGGYALQACIPFKHITGLVPNKLKTRTAHAEETALRFAVTVVPAEGILDPKVVDILWDPFYSFDTYCPVFLDLLHTTSRSRYGCDFTKIDHAQRETVIASILDDGGTGADLVNGAMMAVQCSFYAGIADPDVGCPTIGFHGRNGVGQGEPSFVPELNGPATPIAQRYIN